MPHRLMNDRTRRAVAFDVEVAATRSDRRRGLLGRESLNASEGLLLSPCIAVHTAFMRFPIDLVFIDRDGRADFLYLAPVPLPEKSEALVRERQAC